jgi:hypothetical protein
VRRCAPSRRSTRGKQSRPDEENSGQFGRKGLTPLRGGHHENIFLWIVAPVARNWVGDSLPLSKDSSGGTLVKQVSLGPGAPKSLARRKTAGALRSSPSRHPAHRYIGRFQFIACFAQQLDREFQLLQGDPASRRFVRNKEIAAGEPSGPFLSATQFATLSSFIGSDSQSAVRTASRPSDTATHQKKSRLTADATRRPYRVRSEWGHYGRPRNTTPDPVCCSVWLLGSIRGTVRSSQNFAPAVPFGRAFFVYPQDELGARKECLRMVSG